MQHEVAFRWPRLRAVHVRTTHTAGRNYSAALRAPRKRAKAVARSAGTAVAELKFHDRRFAVQLPRFVQIEPVGLCNLRCRMCPIQFRLDANDGSAALMDYDTFCRLVDRFPQLDQLHLQGLGEPLLHPYFFDMVRYAARRRGVDEYKPYGA